MISFSKLNELENQKAITIGENRTHANNFFYKQTLAGKLLNWEENY